ncbi:DUF2252 family protein [Streptomyces sp. NPDC001340]
MTSHPPADGSIRHRTPQERAALGKAARSSVPRSSHAEFAPGQKRPDPVEVIEAQSAKRVPELVPIRYGRVAESPFRFYRGAAAIMAGGLAGTPRSGITAQLCAGFVIAGRAGGFSAKERARVVRATVRSYRARGIWDLLPDAERGALEKQIRRLLERYAKTLQPDRRFLLEQYRIVRQLRDGKGLADPERMLPPGLQAFGEMCGASLARAHARSGDRIAIASYLGSGDVFDRALVTFAELYADQNERDHQALVDAVRTGRVTAAAA